VSSRRRRWLGFAAIPIAAALLLALGWLLPLEEILLGLAARVRGSGAQGIAIYAGAYVLAALALLPGSALTLLAGFVWGPVWGTLLVSPVSVLAAALTFLLGRTGFRRRVERRIAGDRRFAAIDRAVSERGFRIVLLLRLSPIVPYNLINYALGMTRVRFVDYLAASFLGMLPGTLLYVYLGSLVTTLSEVASGGKAFETSAGKLLYAFGLIATLAVAVLLTRIARRALSGVMAQGQTS
jgi:uncharacterized membrane protein YdjX (TVP38/TMEM64 family)